MSIFKRRAHVDFERCATNFAFGYTGTYTDPVTGLQLHGVRWYNPGSQRWLTQDPLGLGPDTNPYRYCGNGPTDGTDPSGLTGTWPRGRKPTPVFPLTGDACGPYVVFDISARDWPSMFGWGLTNQWITHRPGFGLRNSENNWGAQTPAHPTAFSDLVAIGDFCCNSINLASGGGGHINGYVMNLKAGTYDVTYSYHITITANGQGNKASATMTDARSGNGQVVNQAVNGTVGRGIFDSELQTRNVQVTVGPNGQARIFSYEPSVGTRHGGNQCDSATARGYFAINGIKFVTPVQPNPPPKP